MGQGRAMALFVHLAPHERAPEPAPARQRENCLTVPLCCPPPPKSAFAESACLRRNPARGHDAAFVPRGLVGGAQQTLARVDVPDARLAVPRAQQGVAPIGRALHAEDALVARGLELPRVGLRAGGEAHRALGRGRRGDGPACVHQGGARVCRHKGGAARWRITREVSRGGAEQRSQGSACQVFQRDLPVCMSVMRTR